MRKSTLLLIAPVVAVLAIGLSSCSLFGPSNTDIQNAFTAYTNAFSSMSHSSSSTNSAGDVVVTEYNGSSASSSSAVMTLTLNSSDTAATGTMTLTNYSDTSSGYTINGSDTLSLTMPSGQNFGNATSFTFKMSGTLTYSGGIVNTLAMSITDTESNPSSSSPTDSYTGTLTANGTKTLTL